VKVSRESVWARCVVVRSTCLLREHPAYAELQLSVSPVQLAAIKRLGDLALRDPLLVTREGVIIDGYGRKAYAESVGISTLACVEFDIGEEEALRMILSKHGRSAGWIDYNRIRMASRLKNVLRMRARANQQAGGHFKGSSNLTEANVRKEIAEAAGVSEGNVTKFDQLHKSDPQVLNALATGEIRIHRAWLWRELPPQQQREQLRRYRLKKSLKQPIMTCALRKRARRSNRVVLTLAKLKELLQRASSMPSSDGENSELIEIGLIESPGKRVLLTTELYEALWIQGSANENGDEGSIEAVSQGHDS
jgi:hypothetical protein